MNKNKLTVEEVEEIDEIIAIEVMGWEAYLKEDGDMKYWITPTGKRVWKATWAWSPLENFDSCEKILDKLTENGFSYALGSFTYDGNVKYYCNIEIIAVVAETESTITRQILKTIECKASTTKNRAICDAAIGAVRWWKKYKEV